METYQEACMRHAEHQGLLPIMEALSRVYGDQVELEQTGGFCMTVSVPAPQAIQGQPDAFVWVTNDGTEDHPEYIVGFYSSRDEDSTEVYKYVDSIGALGEVVEAFRRGVLQ